MPRLDAGTVPWRGQDTPPEQGLDLGSVKLVAHSLGQCTPVPPTQGPCTGRCGIRGSVLGAGLQPAVGGGSNCPVQGEVGEAPWAQSSGVGRGCAVSLGRESSPLVSLSKRLSTGVGPSHSPPPSTPSTPWSGPGRPVLQEQSSGSPELGLQPALWGSCRLTGATPPRGAWRRAERGDHGRCRTSRGRGTRLPIENLSDLSVKAAQSEEGALGPAGSGPSGSPTCWHRRQSRTPGG